MFSTPSKSAIISISAALVLTVSACDKMKGSASLNNDEQKAGYAIGHDMGQKMKSQSVSVDAGALAAGLSDGLAGKESKLKPEDRDAAMKKLQENAMKKAAEAGEKSAAEGKAYLEKNKAREGVKTTASGLQYEVIKEGTGAKPKATDTVKVHYTGTLTNGTKFDSSVDRGEPIEFPLNGVIPGWTEGVQLMSVGSKYKLFIPPELGYGPGGQGPIPPNSVLVFDVELLDIKKPEGKKK